MAYHDLEIDRQWVRNKRYAPVRCRLCNQWWFELYAFSGMGSPDECPGKPAQEQEEQPSLDADPFEWGRFGAIDY